MDIAERDRAANSLGWDYLLGFADYGVTRKLLDEYLNPAQPEKGHENLNAVFQRLVVSIQNANMKARVIGGSIGGVPALGQVLFDFDPHGVHAEYGDDWSRLLTGVEKKLKPKGKIRQEAQSIWPQFCRGVLSGAEFLQRFEGGTVKEGMKKADRVENYIKRKYLGMPPIIRNSSR